MDVEGSNPFARSIFLLKASELFDFPTSLPFAHHFPNRIPPWEWIKRIKIALADFSFVGGAPHHTIPKGLQIGSKVFLHPSVKLPSHGVIRGPAFIGENCELRPGVFIRENVIFGKNCVIGNSCEYKNTLLLDNVQTPHFNYVGDSILGNRVHLGAGCILANLRFDQKEVLVPTQNGLEKSGLRKLGAMLADDAEVGCNSTLMPGSILEKKSKVAPSLSFSGRLREGQIYAGHRLGSQPAR